MSPSSRRESGGSKVTVRPSPPDATREPCPIPFSSLPKGRTRRNTWMLSADPLMADSRAVGVQRLPPVDDVTTIRSRQM
jgi:hypothetical protein